MNIAQDVLASIFRLAKRDGVNKIIATVNDMTQADEANSGTVLVACAALVAQTIKGAGPEVGPSFRAAFLTMLDSYTGAAPERRPD